MHPWKDKPTVCVPLDAKVAGDVLALPCPRMSQEVVALQGLLLSVAGNLYYARNMLCRIVCTTLGPL